MQTGMRVILESRCYLLMPEYDKIADRASHTPPPWDNSGLTIWQQWDGRKICHMAGMSLNPDENKANTDLVNRRRSLPAGSVGRDATGQRLF